MALFSTFFIEYRFVSTFSLSISNPGYNHNGGGKSKLAMSRTAD